MHGCLWTYFPNQNICSQGDLVHESSVIAQGQTLKACNTQSTEWNSNLTSYSGSTARDVSVVLFKLFFGQSLEVSKFVPHLVRIYPCQYLIHGNPNPNPNIRSTEM